MKRNLLKYLKEQIKYISPDDMDEKSWGYEYGTLLSGNEVIAIIDRLNRLEEVEKENKELKEQKTYLINLCKENKIYPYPPPSTASSQY